MDISPLPKLPEDFRNDPKKVFFLGSGVSMINGVAGWEDLAKGLIIEAQNKDLLDDHYQYEILLQQIPSNPRKVISIVKNIFESKQKIKHCHTTIKKLLRADAKLKREFPIYSLFKRFEAVFVTVNVDELFCDYFASSDVHFDILHINNFAINNLYYLHGNIRDPKTMVLTLDEYLKFYRNPKVVDRLKQLLSGEFRVFFIGCGMREMEILEYIVLKSGQGKHYVLLDFYQHESGRLKFERDYYGSESLTISVVPYQKNQFGFKQLYYVVKNWLDEKQIKEKGFLVEVRVLDEALSKFDPKKVSTVLDIIEKDPYLKDYFFKKVSSIKWFSSLTPLFKYEYNPLPVESGKDKGFFSIPYWSVLIYLEKVSKESVKLEYRGYAEALMNIIRNVTKPDGAPDRRVDNYRTWHSFAKIMANLPLEAIKIEDVDLIAYWLDSKFYNSLVAHEIGRTLLPKFLASDRADDWGKAEKIIDIVTRKGEKRPTMLDSHDLDELFEKNATLLGERCGEQVPKFLARRLEEVVSEKDDNYCYIWRAAIEDHEQNVGTNQPKHALISGLRDVLLSCAGRHDTWNLLKELFEKRKLILKRIVLYVLNCQFHKYREQCQELILENTPALFLETNYRHEFYEFMRAHFKEFTKNKQDEIIGKIDQLTDQWSVEIPVQEQEELNNEIRRMWLKAVQESGYQLSSEMNTKYDLANYKREHPEFPSYMGPVNWGDEQLFSVGELMAKGNVKDIVDFLNSFQGKNRFNEPGYEEAGQVLKQAVKANQQFFEKDISEFLQARYVYQYYTLQAFEEIWNDKRPVAWGKILELSWKIVESEELWKGEPEKKQIGLYVRKDWIPSVISKLIHNGVKDDSWAMPDEHLSKIRKILIRVLEKQKSLPADKWKDAEGLTNAINSPKGQALEAFISCCLRQCRIFEKSKEKAKENKEAFWEEVQPVFGREAEKARNDNFEFSAIAGAYLPNLYYLSKEWVDQNINRIFPKEAEFERNWRNAISGYCYVNTVYTAIYNLLKENGHVEKALKTDFQDWRINDRMVGNVAISYLRGQEELNAKKGPFSIIFQSIWDDQYIEDIIDVFWQHRDEELPGEGIQRILEFWKFTLDHVVQKGIGQYKETLSDLNLLARYLPNKLSEEQKQWLLQCAPYVDERHHSTFFLEYLDRLADSNPKEIGEIFLAMLEKIIPTYKQENICSIVEKLYKAEEKTLANQVCDRYTRAGYEFLRDLFEQYNK